MLIPCVFLPRPFPVIALPMFHPFPSPLFVPSVLEFSNAQRKMTAGCKSWRKSNTLGPHDLQSWRGRVPRATGPFHRAVARVLVAFRFSLVARRCDPGFSLRVCRYS